MQIRALKWVALPVCLLGISQAAVAQLTAVSQQLISSTRINLTQYDYVYSISASSGGTSYTGVSAIVTSSSPNTIVTAGYLIFPYVGASATVASVNTYTIRQDRRFAFNPANLMFTFAAAGGPQANAGPAQLVSAGAIVTLDGSASTDPAQSRLTWLWSFASKPAGSAATLSNTNAMRPTFTADVAGDYVLTLTVNDGTSTSLPATVLVSTNTVPPVSNAGPNQTVSIPKTVQLDGSGSTDVRAHLLTYSWALVSKPAGSAATLSNSTAVKPSMNADVAGNYLVQLIVNDGTLPSAASVVTIATGNTAPVANAGVDQKVTTGSAVQLNGSASTDVNGDALAYHWSILAAPAGSAASLSGATGALAGLTADLAGSYALQLRVSDGALSSFDTVVVSTCACIAPLANAGAQQTAHLSGIAILNAAQSTDPDGLSLSYQWAFLSKPTGSTTSFSGTFISATPQFTADLAGTYVAQLIASDSSFASAPATVTISTSNSQPIANAGPNQNLTSTGTVQLNGNASTDPDGSPLTHRWAILNKPAGSTAALTGAATSQPSFNSDQAGLYIVQLIVNDGTSDSRPAIVLITVTNPPVTISLSSVPSSLNFSVSGTGCSAGNYNTGATGANLSWTIGAACQVTITSPQTGGAGTQFVFASWSDAGTANPRVFVAPASAATYTANMTAQYLLTTSANPAVGGIVTPPSSWYSGAAGVTATAAAGYLFTGFAEALNGVTSPQTLSVSAPASVTANFGIQAVTGCSVFPSNNVWNTRIDSLPVDVNSNAYITTIGATNGLHPDFDSSGGGVPFLTIPDTQPYVATSFEISDESDPGPYPVPNNAPIEDGAGSTGDRHVIVLDNTTCALYELYSGYPQPDGSWTAYSGARFDLTSNQLRPATWTSSDAAGLPVLPGLVRYDEFATGVINHAIRMTAPQTRNTFIWPARHKASSLTDTQYPPMGQRFRLKASFDISSYPADAQVILTALKKYGMILADNGSSWYITGAPDARWNDDAMHAIGRVTGANLEAVDESGLIIDPDSGAALQP